MAPGAGPADVRCRGTGIGALIGACPVPVVLARGEHDPMVTAAQLAGLVVDPVERLGLGHTAHVEDPAAVLRPQPHEMINIDVDRRGGELAGFESWRCSVWDAPAVRELGLTLLPSLAEGDVYAEGPDLEVLRRELDRLAADLPRIAAAVAVDPDAMAFRRDNMRAAAARARGVAAGRGGHPEARQPHPSHSRRNAPRRRCGRFVQ